MAKFVTIVVGVLIMCSGLAFGQGEQEEGDSCVEKNSGKPGVCTLFPSCATAVDNWKLYGIRPTICGYTADTVVVCCERAAPRPARPPVRRPTPTRFQETNTNKRISQLKCEEYSKPVTETISYISLTPDPEPVGLTVANCTYDKVELVVGGDPALPGQFPHMVAIGWPSVRGGHDFKCGGTLVSERFVLTAGHCIAASSRDTDVTSIEPTVIRLGDLDLRPDQFDGARPVDARIKRIVKHPSYQPPATYNDIALLEMERDVEFNPYVRPACLWQKAGFEGLESGIVTGWGAIAYRGARSDVLLKVSLKLLNNNVCQPLLSALRNRKWRDGFSKEQMCAGDLDGKHDSCQGDSGGPLQVNLNDNHCIFYVMGITSFGYDCGKVNGPGVYTRVSSFIPWIESVVWPNGA